MICESLVQFRKLYLLPYTNTKCRNLHPQYVCTPIQELDVRYLLILFEISDSLHNLIQRLHTAGQYCFVDLELVVVEGVAFSGDSSQEYGEEAFCFAEITVSIISGEE